MPAPIAEQAKLHPTYSKYCWKDSKTLFEYCMVRTTLLPHHEMTLQYPKTVAPLGRYQVLLYLQTFFHRELRISHDTAVKILVSLYCTYGKSGGGGQ